MGTPRSRPAGGRHVASARTSDAGTASRRRRSSEPIPESSPLFTPHSTIAEIYAHPLGRDIIDRILYATGRSPLWLRPLLSMTLGTFGRLTRRVTGPGFVEALMSLLDSVPDRFPDDVVLVGGAPGAPEPAWWKEAVFYQIYPRSFQDSDGDGIGDLRGIVSRLDYLADLGVDCLWLSPIFDSPNEDMGYDVRDYRAVMPEMGTLADLDELIEGCHQRGMRIILDLVVNHTSVEHEWFQRALADPDGPYGDYYIMRPGTPDVPPNNWTSFFSGSAWRWFPEAERWALRLFAPGQIDLNWDNPAVRTEMADIVRWWLDRGIDGFRMDVTNYISKAEGLPDGNEFIGALMEFTGVEHYFYGPKLHPYLRELREAGFTRTREPRSTPRRRHDDGTLGDPLPPDPVGVMVGETPGIGIETGRLLTAGSRKEMDLAFVFDVLETPGKIRWDRYRYNPNYLKEYFIEYSSRVTSDDWIALFFDNHDNPRMLSKIGNGAEADAATRTAIGKLLATIQLTLRGSPFLFQGQEIGAANQAFTSIDDLRDIESLNRWEELLAAGKTPEKAWKELLAGTRDHARVPMRWDASGGFTTGTAWIEGREVSGGFSAAEQAIIPTSIFHWYKRLIALRRAEPTLIYGDVAFLHPQANDYFAYTRGGEWLVEMNLSDRSRRRPEFAGELETVVGTRDPATMAPYEATVSRIAG